jgi:hypothetical protein
MWLNIPVNGGMYWPREKHIIEYKGEEITLSPPTKENMPSIHIEYDGYSTWEKQTLINELLSIIAWKSDQPAVVDDGGLGTILFRNIPRNGKQIYWSTIIDYPKKFTYIEDEKKRLAIALYREGLNINSAPYQFLSFFKIINIRYQDKWIKKKNEIVNWIKENIDKISSSTNKEILLKLRESNIDISMHLYSDCRCAIAHANQKPIVNPDDSVEIYNLYNDIGIIRELAGYFIETEMKVSRFIYD